MRNLDSINPKEMKPSKFVGICACLPLLLGLISLPLAYGAVPYIPLADNHVAQLLFLVSGGSIVLALVSLVCQWDWKIQYYGLSLLFGSSISIFAIVPLLVLMTYGTAPTLAKTFVFWFYVGSHVSWCRKFAVLYKDVFDNELLRKIMYQEEADAVYYLRRGDQYLLDKYYEFTQIPRAWIFAVFTALALALVPVMGEVRAFTGIPFAHVFLLVGMLPVSWMSFGFAVRGFLVCYFYPAKIRTATGKDVYVDIVGKHPQLDIKTLRENGVKKPRV